MTIDHVCTNCNAPLNTACNCTSCQVSTDAVAFCHVCTEFNRTLLRSSYFNRLDRNDEDRRKSMGL